MPHETISDAYSAGNLEHTHRATSQSGVDLLSLLAAAGAGATVMYFLDPGRGRRRRRLVGDKLVHAAHVTGGAVGATARDVANHAEGLAAVARRRFESDDADDVVLEERVRAKLGRVASHAGAIDVLVEDGTVTLCGPVLAREADRLIEEIAGVRGVQDVNDRLERHERPDGVAALQGSAQTPTSRLELLQENWTPTARLLTTVTGGALAAVALRDRQRQNPLAGAAGLAGLALLVRGATNMPFSRLLGAGAGHKAVSVQKSIKIAAPVDEVFAWLTEWERWPEWMSHVREVRSSGAREGEGERTHWVVDGPAGTSISWDAVTTRLECPELIAWKTAEGSRIAHSGRMRLVPTEDGFTRVDVHMAYNPVAGAAGHAVAALFGRDPKHQLDDDLARLKTVIETGRLPHDAAAKRGDAKGAAESGEVTIT